MKMKEFYQTLVHTDNNGPGAWSVHLKAEHGQAGGAEEVQKDEEVQKAKENLKHMACNFSMSAYAFFVVTLDSQGEEGLTPAQQLLMNKVKGWSDRTSVALKNNLARIKVGVQANILIDNQNFCQSVDQLSDQAINSMHTNQLRAAYLTNNLLQRLSQRVFEDWFPEDARADFAAVCDVVEFDPGLITEQNKIDALLDLKDAVLSFRPYGESSGEAKETNATSASARSFEEEHSLGNASLQVGDFSFQDRLMKQPLMKQPQGDGSLPRRPQNNQANLIHSFLQHPEFKEALKEGCFFSSQLTKYSQVVPNACLHQMDGAGSTYQFLRSGTPVHAKGVSEADIAQTKSNIQQAIAIAKNNGYEKVHFFALNSPWVDGWAGFNLIALFAASLVVSLAPLTLPTLAVSIAAFGIFSGVWHYYSSQGYSREENTIGRQLEQITSQATPDGYKAAIVPQNFFRVFARTRSNQVTMSKDLSAQLQKDIASFDHDAVELKCAKKKLDAAITLQQRPWANLSDSRMAGWGVLMFMFAIGLPILMFAIGFSWPGLAILVGASLVMGGLSWQLTPTSNENLDLILAHAYALDVLNTYYDETSSQEDARKDKTLLWIACKSGKDRAGATQMMIDLQQSWYQFIKPDVPLMVNDPVGEEEDEEGAIIDEAIRIPFTQMIMRMHNRPGDDPLKQLWAEYMDEVADPYLQSGYQQQLAGLVSAGAVNLKYESRFVIPDGWAKKFKHVFDKNWSNLNKKTCFHSGGPQTEPSIPLDGDGRKASGAISGPSQLAHVSGLSKPDNTSAGESPSSSADNKKTV
jgi:hypothetical protein